VRLTARHLADFHEHGFLILPALFSRADADVRRAEPHRDFTPVVPLADDRLLAPATGPGAAP
jgi:hypothetical protein